MLPAANQRDLGIILAIEVSNPSAWTAPSAHPPTTHFVGASAGPFTGRPGVVIAKALGSTMQVLARGESPPEDSHSDGLIVSIAQAMKLAGLSPKQIATVAVSAGPGGYTAVRLAITTAKMIAEVHGAACIPVPTAHCVAHSALTNITAAQPLVVALASKGESCFLTEFAGETVSEGKLLTAAEWNPVGTPTLIADSFLPQSFVAKAASLGLQRGYPVFDALACASICHRYPAVDPIRLTPIYPREPEAVTKWRALHGKTGA